MRYSCTLMYNIQYTFHIALVYEGHLCENSLSDVLELQRPRPPKGALDIAHLAWDSDAGHGCQLTCQEFAVVDNIIWIMLRFKA